MIEITTDFRSRIIDALLEARNNYDGSDAAFAKKHGISASIYSRIKNGDQEKVLRPEQWLNLEAVFWMSPLRNDAGTWRGQKCSM